MKFCRLLDTILRKVWIDLIPLTKDELRLLIEKGSTFFKEILDKSKIVYERNNSKVARLR